LIINEVHYSHPVTRRSIVVVAERRRNAWEGTFLQGVLQL